MRLFHKTFGYMLVMFGTLIIVIHLSVYAFLPRFYLRDIEEKLSQHMEVAEGIVSELDAGQVRQVLETYADKNSLSILAEIDGEKYVYQKGEIQVDIFLEEGDKIRLGGPEKKELGSVESIVACVRSLESRDQKKVKLQFMESTTPVKDAREATVSLLPVTAALSLLISFVFSYFYSKKITRPILEMAEATGGMERLEEDACCPVRGEDEMGVLAERINCVYRELWETVRRLEEEKHYIEEMERQKVNFLRAASHELKTPLATLRILLENMQYNVGKFKEHEKYLPQGIEQVDRLSTMVQEILDTSKLQNQSKKEKLMLCQEIQAVLSAFEIQGREKKLNTILDVEEGFSVSMNQEALRKVLENLIGNAVQYSPENGEIRIWLDQKELYIQNTCDPLEERHLKHIFEAFYRPDFARSRNAGGNGLGLYLVSEILKMEKIPFEFVPREDGMCFVIDFSGKTGAK